MKNNRVVYIVVSFCVLLLIGLLYSFNFFGNDLSSEYQKIIINLSDKDFITLVSDTPESRQGGLGGFERLEENEAMIFVFPQNGFHSFWMKDMLFSIDILWLDENKMVIHYEKDVSPNTFPQSFTPRSLSRYVIEFNSGTLDELGVKEGDYVLIP